MAGVLPETMLCDLLLRVLCELVSMDDDSLLTFSVIVLNLYDGQGDDACHYVAMSCSASEM